MKLFGTKFSKNFTEQMLNEGYRYVEIGEYPYFEKDYGRYIVSVGANEHNGFHLLKFEEKKGGNCVFFLGWVRSMRIVNHLVRVLKKGDDE